MTLWHKRLLIFLSKALGAIIGIIIICLFLYFYFYFKKDNLIKYVPPNAILYSTFRLNNELKANPPIKKILAGLNQDYNLPDFDFSNLNYMVGYNFALALIPNQEQKDLSFDYLLIFDLNGNQDNAALYLNYFKEKNWPAQILSNQTLNKNILIISNSANVIDKVKKIAGQEEPSLAQNVNTQLNLNKFDLSFKGKIYINLQALADNLNAIPEPQAKLLLASLKTDGLDELFLGLKDKDDKLILENLESQFSFEANQSLFSKVPIDSDFIFSFNNGQEKFAKIYNQLSRLDNSYFQQLEKNKQYLEGLYNFNLENDILDLFTGQAEIAIDWQNHFILALKTDQISDLPVKMSKIEQIFIQYIAAQNPISKEKVLPDYSTIMQIVKEPANYKFEQEQISGLTLNYIQNNQEMAYFINANTIFLANSREKMHNFLNNQDLVDKNEINICIKENMTDYSQNLILKSSFSTKYYPILAKYFTNLVIKGDFEENGKIWLCLD